MQITWNTDVNAPCCPGEILAEDGRSILIQTDWDYPGTARSFGWWIGAVQICEACGHIQTDCEPDPAENRWKCEDCDHVGDICEHSGTDGTIDCPKCGVRRGAFIETAGNWLSDADGVTVDDPGYFDGAE